MAVALRVGWKLVLAHMADLLLQEALHNNTSTLPTEAASLAQLQLAFEEEQVSSALFCTIGLCYKWKNRENDMNWYENNVMTLVLHQQDQKTILYNSSGVWRTSSGTIYTTYFIIYIYIYIYIYILLRYYMYKRTVC